MPSSNFFPMDAFDGARITIDSTHHEVHEGAMNGFHYENLAPASGLTTYIHIKTGAVKSLHSVFEFNVFGGNLKVFMYDGATVGTAGTLINHYNMNRLFPDNSLDTKIYLNSTVGTVGTAFDTRTLLASSTVTNKTSTAVRDGVERVLAPNKDYIIAITTTAVSQAFTVDGIIGEHPDAG